MMNLFFRVCSGNKAKSSQGPLVYYSSTTGLCSCNHAWGVPHLMLLTSYQSVVVMQPGFRRDKYFSINQQSVSHYNHPNLFNIDRRREYCDVFLCYGVISVLRVLQSNSSSLLETPNKPPTTTATSHIFLSVRSRFMIVLGIQLTWRVRVERVNGKEGLTSSSGSGSLFSFHGKPPTTPSHNYTWLLLSNHRLFQCGW